MREEINLKISQFVDGELDAENAFKVLKSMQQDSQAAETFSRYEAVSQALKTDVFLNIDAGFVDRVSERLKDEPIIFRPAKLPSRDYVKASAAVAASLAVAAVIIAGALQYRDKQIAGRIELARQQTSEQIYVDSSPSQEDDTRFNEYLEAHGATLYAGSHATTPSYGASEAYGQVVNYGRK
ncbi:MAG: sigma-E factor negative regulatory protein [Gammaproteobacteria bacterium]